MSLENLERINKLHVEAPDQEEIKNLILAASERLSDSQKTGLSYSSRFDLAYNASHGLALAALRAAGYRSDQRYIVFQCLQHTSGLAKGRIRIFSTCHERRNLAEYEGHYEKDEQLLAELIDAGNALLTEFQV
ncbi:MAG: hypothetical protein CMP91_03685 [Gammaproteobacteria bacterium]|nr:hypothetical protein [Gammaproteobacteria bacterium]MAY02715.1 hypothetical protein [Gammaproteobacteria bacterium]|tara:strand:- start:1169 stop:1567 length:399 start_codon:yes stop_codon:yes gene_type:complete